MFQCVDDLLETKCFKIIEAFDDQISRNLINEGIETRPSKSNGLWCCSLLPTILTMYTLMYRDCPLYNLVSYISIGLLFYCLLFIIFISISCLVLKEPVYGGCIAASLISALLIYTFLGQDLLFSLLFPLPSVYMYSTFLRLSIIWFPKTFTIGEAMVVTQGVVLFIVMWFAKFVCNFEESNKELHFVTTIVFTMLSTVGLIVTAVYYLKEDWKDLDNLGYVVIAGLIWALIVLHLVIGHDCIYRILVYVFMDQNRCKLFTMWVFLALLAVCVVVVRTRQAVRASTVTRKAFHVLAALVFLSGVLRDVTLSMLAAGFGLALIIFVEALRKSNIQPISSALQSAFLIYSDEKDSGSFAMTPIYLYCALACPLLLVPHECTLELLSGVLSIGVGDTAASWFGSRYGFNKWSGGNRTWEGTIFNILSQVATVYALELFELLHSKNALIRTALAATVSGLVEAKTDQVDNLILPLVTIIAFQFTSFLS